jgi:hypothetical protein
MALSILFPPVIEAVRFWNQFYWLPLPRVLIDQVKGEGVLPADQFTHVARVPPCAPGCRELARLRWSELNHVGKSAHFITLLLKHSNLQNLRSPSLPKAFGQFPTVVYSLALSGATDAVSSVGAK